MKTTTKLCLLYLILFSTLPFLSGCGGKPPKLSPAEQAEVDKYLSEYGRNSLLEYLDDERKQNKKSDPDRIFKYVKYFVAQGADVNAKDDKGITPLHVAVASENIDVVKILVSKGANVNAKDGQGMTPLHVAVVIKNADIVKFLVSQGADVNAKTEDNFAPLDLAIERRNIDVVKIFVPSEEEYGRTMCSDNLRQILFAIHIFHDTQHGLPPLYIFDKDDKPLHSWRTLILPFIGQGSLYEQIRLDEPWDSEHNKQFHNVVIPIYSCPANNSCKPGKDCTYAVIAGTVSDKDGSWTSGPFRPAINSSSPYDPQKWEPRDTYLWWQDGTSNQIAVVEVKKPFCWMDPTADLTLEDISQGVNTPNARAGGFHSGGINIAFGDGTVRFIRNSVDPQKLKALANVNDGAVVNIDE